MILVLACTIGALYTIGAWLLMQRSLTRIVIGLAILGHGANLLLLTAGGRAGGVPIAGADPATTSDPLPQALALTAIVITFGVSGFLLAMAYRSWRQRRDDTVEDDLEDRRLAAAVRRLDQDRARRETREAAHGEIADQHEVGVGPGGDG
ncbi:Na(+)/H(+) antiporter subunit C [Salsipaludibacter albus]|uniref:Na(+)/H(+) antiporter subunit C n=1 Tax=Salsipaludibacter albus TaxID=2849650 RepID=UPI001EE462A7|nr:Na(+)/H(+) antiporter subunit C [Salsipaludibacter albus]MBY5162643.1 Na(+)/H(+) antiporter subunit C [Salsipaludibacter albus]